MVRLLLGKRILKNSYRKLNWSGRQGLGDEETGFSCQGILWVFSPKGDEKPMRYFEQRADVMFVLDRSFSKDLWGWAGKDKIKEERTVKRTSFGWDLVRVVSLGMERKLIDGECN